MGFLAIFTFQLDNRWVSVVEFYDPTLGIGKVFGQKSTVVKWNCCILWIHIAQMYLQLPLRQWGAGNVYLLVLSSWKINIAKNSIAVMWL